MKIYKRSIFTGAVNEMDLPVTQEQIFRYKSGGLVQDVFPELSAEQREFIMTGASLEEQRAIFGKEEE